MSLIEHLARPDPELGPLLAQLGPPAPDTDDVLVLREQFEVAGLLHQAEWEDRAPAGEFLVPCLECFEGSLTWLRPCAPQRPHIACTSMTSV